MITATALGAATYWSATAPSYALEELVGQFDSVQRSLLFPYVGLEQGAYQLYIAHPRQARQAIKPTDSLQKAVPLIFLLLAPGGLTCLEAAARERQQRARSGPSDGKIDGRSG